jgi:hypothetical protein
MFIEKLKNLNWKDIGVRALKTFIQAFVSSFTIDAVFGVTTFDGLKSVLISILIAATASAISATWNFVTNYISEKIAVLEIADEETESEAE